VYVFTQTGVNRDRMRPSFSLSALQPKRSTFSGGIVGTESLSVRVFLLAGFLGQPKSLQSRDLFTNNLCLGFVANRESILPRSLLQPRLHSHVFRISGHRALLFRAQKRDPIAFTRNTYARNAMKKSPTEGHTNSAERFRIACGVYAINTGIWRHKSGGAALISEMPDTFKSRWISL
jgi:hypothetical protein